MKFIKNAQSHSLIINKGVCLACICFIFTAYTYGSAISGGAGIESASLTENVISFTLNKDFNFSPTTPIYITYTNGQQATSEWGDNLFPQWTKINYANDSSCTNTGTIFPENSSTTLMANKTYYFTTDSYAITGIYLSEPTNGQPPIPIGCDTIYPQVSIPYTKLTAANNSFESNSLISNQQFDSQMESLVNQEDNDPYYPTTGITFSVEQDMNDLNMGNVEMITNMDASGNVESPNANPYIYTSLPSQMPPANEEFFLYLDPNPTDPASMWNFYFIEHYLTQFLNSKGISYVMLFDNGVTCDNINTYLFSQNLKSALFLSHGTYGSPYLALGNSGIGYGMDSILNYAETTHKTINPNAGIFITSCYGFTNIGYALINSGAREVYGAYLTMDVDTSERPHILMAAAYAEAQKMGISCSLTDAMYYVNNKLGQNNPTNAFGVGLYADYDQNQKLNIASSSDFNVVVTKSATSPYEWNATVTNASSTSQDIKTLTVANAYPVMTCAYNGKLISQEAVLDNQATPSVTPVYTNMMVIDPEKNSSWTDPVQGFTTDSHGDYIDYNVFENLDSSYTGNAVWSSSDPISVGAKQSVTFQFDVIPYFVNTSEPYNNLSLSSNQVLINQKNI